MTDQPADVTATSPVEATPSTPTSDRDARYRIAGDPIEALKVVLAQSP